MREKGRVATLAGIQPDELVCYLTVEKLDDAHTGERQLAALGVVNQSATLGQGRVLLK